MRERLAAGEIDLLIGTTALNNEDDRFRSLGLVIVDEQHRFGVRQRAQLGKKDSGAGQFHEVASLGHSVFVQVHLYAT